jgi:hypothetical protein
MECPVFHTVIQSVIQIANTVMKSVKFHIAKYLDIIHRILEIKDWDCEKQKTP